MALPQHDSRPGGGKGGEDLSAGAAAETARHGCRQQADCAGGQRRQYPDRPRRSAGHQLGNASQ